MEYTLSEVTGKLSSLVSSKDSFVISGLSGKMIEAAEIIEKAIEAHGMSCRVYTRNRGYAVAAASLVPWAGWAVLGAFVGHRLSTRNPDFEVGKDIGANKIYVDYKKKK